MRKWSKLKWYQYHQAKAQEAAVKSSTTRELSVIKTIQKEIQDIEEKIDRLKGAQSITSYLFGNFFNTDERREINITNLILEQRKMDLRNACAAYDLKAKISAMRGMEQYERGRLERKLAATEAALERRMRYLERSTAIRSAQVGLKAYLVNTYGQEDFIECYYCETKIVESEVEIEHKTPIVRGGTNDRKNLTLACRSCNREKGKKTEAEYRKYLLNKN